MGSNNLKSSQESQKSTRYDTIHGLDFIEDGPLKNLLIQFVDIIFKIQELEKSTKVLKKSGSHSQSPRLHQLEARVTSVEFNEIKKLHGTDRRDIYSALRKFINIHEQDSTWRPNKLSSKGKRDEKIFCSVSVDELKKIKSWCQILGKDWNISELMRALLCSSITPDNSRERVMREFVEKNPSILEKLINPAQKKNGGRLRSSSGKKKPKNREG